MRKKSSGANLAAMARELNLSTATISRALRNADGIHQETRERILKVAESMGYTKHLSKDTKLIRQPHGIMALAQCSSPATDQGYLAGMSRASVALNLAILSHHLKYEDCMTVLNSAYLPSAMRSGLVEGVVLIHLWPAEAAKSIAERWPTVSIVHQYPDAPIDHVGIDDRQGIHLLMKTLQEAGHKKIGFFGLCKEMSWSCARFAAYAEAMVTAELDLDPKSIIKISLKDALSPTLFQIGNCAEEILRQIKHGVDAWVCSSVITGYALCNCLLENGLKIPDDVAVAGFHAGSHPTPTGLPALTSTDIPDEELGATALRRLIHRMDQPNELKRSILLPSKFLQGETTRKVAGK